MFGGRFFGLRYFAARYFGKVGATMEIVPTPAYRVVRVAAEPRTARVARESRTVKA